MNHFDINILLAQAIGLFAFFIGFNAFTQKNDMLLKKRMTYFCLAMSLHFFLMHAFVAATGIALNALRSYLSLKTQSQLAMSACITAMWLLILPNTDNGFELMILIGNSIATFAYFSLSGLKLRFSILFNTCCWLCHNLSIASIGASMIEFVFALVNLSTIFQMVVLRMKKREI